MVKIVSAATAYPKEVLSPARVREELRGLLGGSSDMLSLLLGMVDSSGVKNRFTVRPLEKLLQERPLEQKTDDFIKGSIALGAEVTQKALDKAGLSPKDIDLLVTVSCTGFMIPSLDAYLMNQFGFRPDCRRLPLTELGCAGGAAGIATARDLLRHQRQARAHRLRRAPLPHLSISRHDPGRHDQRLVIWRWRRRCRPLHR